MVEIFYPEEIIVNWFFWYILLVLANLLRSVIVITSLQLID